MKCVMSLRSPTKDENGGLSLHPQPQFSKEHEHKGQLAIGSFTYSTPTLPPLRLTLVVYIHN